MNRRPGSTLVKTVRMIFPSPPSCCLLSTTTQYLDLRAESERPCVGYGKTPVPGCRTEPSFTILPSRTTRPTLPCLNECLGTSLGAYFLTIGLCIAPPCGYDTDQSLRVKDCASSTCYLVNITGLHGVGCLIMRAAMDLWALLPPGVR